MIETYSIQIITGVGSVSLVGVVGYFLKKQNDKIEGMSTMKEDLKLNIQNMGSDLHNEMHSTKEEIQKDMKENKGEIIQLFQDVCRERQGSCGRLMEQKLETIRTEGQSVCRKIDSIKQDRASKWKKQDIINDQVKTHIAKANNNNG